MPLTVATFRDRYPEFVNTPTLIVQACLDAAYRRTPYDMWGDIQDDGAGCLTAHLLALSPFARDMKLASEKGATVYGAERQRLNRIVSAGYRIAGLPSLTDLEVLGGAGGGAAPPVEGYADAGFYASVTPFTVAVAAAGTRYLLAPTLDVGDTYAYAHAAGVWTYSGGAGKQDIAFTAVVGPVSGASTHLSAGLYVNGILSSHDQAVIIAANKTAGTIVFQSIKNVNPGDTFEIRVANELGAVAIEVWSAHWSMRPL